MRTMDITPASNMGGMPAKPSQDMHRVKRLYFIYGVAVTALLMSALLLGIYLMLQAGKANSIFNPYVPAVNNGYQNGTSSSVSASSTSSAASTTSSSTSTSTATTKKVTGSQTVPNIYEQGKNIKYTFTADVPQSAVFTSSKATGQATFTVKGGNYELQVVTLPEGMGETFTTKPTTVAIASSHAEGLVRLAQTKDGGQYYYSHYGEGAAGCSAFQPTPVACHGGGVGFSKNAQGSYAKVHCKATTVAGFKECDTIMKTVLVVDDLPRT